MGFLLFLTNMNFSPYNTYARKALLPYLMLCTLMEVFPSMQSSDVGILPSRSLIFQDLSSLHSGVGWLSSQAFLPVFVKKLLRSLTDNMNFISISVWSHGHHNPGSDNLLNAIRSSCFAETTGNRPGAPVKDASRISGLSTKPGSWTK